MQSDQVTGVLRAILPAIIAYLVGSGVIPAGAAADISAAALAIFAAGWSWYSNSKQSKVAAVAAMPETKVEGNVIVIKDHELALTAKAAATPNTVER